MSFENLTNQVVESCSGLTSRLFYPSTPKCLPQLRKLGVSRCPSLRQIIANCDNDHDDERANNIVFGQLEILVLADLRRLEAFCWGNSASVLKFPRLKKLVVDGCWGMKTFSPGNVECSINAG